MIVFTDRTEKTAPDGDDKNTMDKTKIKTLVALHLLMMVYSTSTIFSKLASATSFLSFSFCIYYGCVIALLGIYAIGWQQIIKRLPLTTAFANKAVTVVWGIVWGMCFFQEKLTWGKVIGAILVICGVILFVYADKENEHAE